LQALATRSKAAEDKGRALLGGANAYWKPVFADIRRRVHDAQLQKQLGMTIEPKVRNATSAAQFGRHSARILPKKKQKTKQSNVALLTVYLQFFTIGATISRSEVTSSITP
jgi:hypothetical protein